MPKRRSTQSQRWTEKLAEKKANTAHEYSCSTTLTHDRMQINVKTLRNKTMGLLYDLRKEGIMCDVIIKVEGGEIKAHRCILVVGSEYFKAMFLSGLVETENKSIEIPGISYQLMSDVVEFMYTGELTVAMADIQEMLMLADMIQLIEIKAKCEDYLIAKIDLQNCIELYMFARQYSCEHLMERCKNHILMNFVLIYSRSEFLQLSPDVLAIILKWDNFNLDCYTEDDVIKSCVKWLLHNPIERGNVFMEKIIPCLRMKYISLECMDHIKDQLNEAGTDIIETLMDYYHENVKIDVKNRHCQNCVHVLQGFIQSRTGSSCPQTTTHEVYNPQSNTWSNKDITLPNTFSSMYVIKTTTMVVIVGVSAATLEGRGAKSCGFNPLTSQTKHNMDNKFLDNTLDIIYDSLLNGGAICYCKASQEMYIVDNFDVHVINMSNRDGDVRFTYKEKLPIFAMDLPEWESDGRVKFLNCQLVKCQGKIYVIGGEMKYSSCVSVPASDTQSYTMGDQSWARCSRMNYVRTTFQAVELNGKIYAIGGFDGTKRSKTVEVYDPQTNTWTLVSSMHRYRTDHQALVMDGKIYVIGGKSYSDQGRCGGARKVLKDCEVYDPVTDTWTEIAKMASSRCKFGAVVVPESMTTVSNSGHVSVLDCEQECRITNSESVTKNGNRTTKSRIVYNTDIT